MADAEIPRSSTLSFRRSGYDLLDVDQAVENTMSHIYASLPNFAVYYDRLLPPALAASDGVDRISRLPRELQRQIVSRLPIKDAARTAILSSLWGTIWLSTPLVLIDAHLLPKRQAFRPTPADSPAITAAVSSILEAHPGPFSCVHLACSHMNMYRPQLKRWLQLLAAKGVQDLVLVNRPWPYNVPLPSTVFSITTLNRLYLGIWKLPEMAVLRGVSFPHLRELGICCLFMKHGDVEYLIARCPELDILNILGGRKDLRLRLVSQTLRCVQVSNSMLEDIIVVKAPRLERLIVYESRQNTRGVCPQVWIRDAPNLHAIGYLESGQVLQIRDTFIMPGIKVSTQSMLSSVKVLSLNVRFGVLNDVKMVPTFLKCFPNVERLHIMSKKCDKPPTAYLTLKFWEKSGPIESFSHIKVMILREFRWEQSGVFFLQYFFQSAHALKFAAIVSPNSSLISFSQDELQSKVMKCCSSMASKKCTVKILSSNGSDGGEPWKLQNGGDFSTRDPFPVADVM